jgi:hypothetical protein
MKKALILALLFTWTAQAQTIGVKDIPADVEGETTIAIKKGPKAIIERKYEVVTTEDEIEGDSAPLLKEARTNWKKACSDWKNETKELNKDNRVMQMSCGKMRCSTESMESTCTSKSKLTLRVPLND